MVASVGDRPTLVRGTRVTKIDISLSTAANIKLEGSG